MKKPPSYWERRAEARLIAQEQKGFDLAKVLQQVYGQAQYEIEQLISTIYQRYLSGTVEEDFLATLRQKMTKKELGEHARFITKAVKEIQSTNPDWQGLNKLIHQVDRVQVTRLDGLVQQINSTMSVAKAKQMVLTEQTLTEQYTDAFYRASFDASQQAGIGLSFNLIPKKQVEKAVNQSFAGAKFSQRIWGDTQALEQNLSTIIPQGLIRGMSSQDMAKQLQGVVGGDFNSAMRLIRTETNRITNDATIDGYKASGVAQGYRILATLDKRTSSICQDLDGKEFALDEAIPGKTMPPFHPNCRTTTTAVLPDIAKFFAEYENGAYADKTPKQELQRRAKVDEGMSPWIKPKYIKVPASMTYKQYMQALKDNSIGEAHVAPESFAELEKYGMYAPQDTPFENMPDKQTLEKSAKETKSLMDRLGKEYKGYKGQNAIDKLMQEKQGHVKGAIYRDDIGDIDLMWGNHDKETGDGVGLVHAFGHLNDFKTQEKKDAFVANLADAIENGELIETQDNGRYKIWKNKITVIIEPKVINDQRTTIITAIPMSTKPKPRIKR